jgi:zinc transporter 5/7
MFVFICALCLSFVWNHPHVIKIVVMDKIKTIISEEHAVSYGCLFVFIFYMISTNLLAQPLRKVKGSFIGYSSGGYPLYSLTGETLKRTSISMVVVCKNILKEILSHSDSRSIFYFLCVNLMFTFIELSYGAWTNSK